jgi:hypothetical protein
VREGILHIELLLAGTDPPSPARSIARAPARRLLGLELALLALLPSRVRTTQKNAKKTQQTQKTHAGHILRTRKRRKRMQGTFCDPENAYRGIFCDFFAKF